MSTIKTLRGGKGPSEFLSPQDIISNENYIAIAEYGNMRIQIFDKNFNYLRTAPMKSLHPNKTLGLSNDHLLQINNISSENPILSSFNIKTGVTVNANIPLFFQGGSYAAYNNLVVRSDDNFIGICSVGAPYMLIYNTKFELKYFIQFKNSRIEMLFDRIKSTLSNSSSGNEVSSIRLLLDFAIKDGVLFVNTFESGRIISLDLDQKDSQYGLEWKVYDASRPKRNSSDSTGSTIQPITMKFAIHGSKIAVYDMNNINDFFDIIEY